MNAHRPDEEGYRQGLHLFLTPERRRLIDELEAIAFDMGAVETNRRIGIAAEDRYDGHHHITQLLVRKNLKQCEFVEELICALRGGRTGVALALTPHSSRVASSSRGRLTINSVGPQRSGCSAFSGAATRRWPR